MMGSSPGPPRRQACPSEGVLTGKSVCTLSYVRERIPTDFNSFWLRLQSGVWCLCAATLPSAQVIFLKLLAAPSPLLRVFTQNKQHRCLVCKRRALPSAEVSPCPRFYSEGISPFPCKEGTMERQAGDPRTARRTALLSHQQPGALDTHHPAPAEPPSFAASGGGLRGRGRGRGTPHPGFSPTPPPHHPSLP